MLKIANQIRLLVAGALLGSIGGALSACSAKFDDAPTPLPASPYAREIAEHDAWSAAWSSVEFDFSKSCGDRNVAALATGPIRIAGGAAQNAAQNVGERRVFATLEPCDYAGGTCRTFHAFVVDSDGAGGERISEHAEIAATFDFYSVRGESVMTGAFGEEGKAESRSPLAIQFKVPPPPANAEASLWARLFADGARMTQTTLAASSPVRALLCRRAERFGKFASMVDDNLLSSTVMAAPRIFSARRPDGSGRSPSLAWIRLTDDGSIAVLPSSAGGPSSGLADVPVFAATVAGDALTFGDGGRIEISPEGFRIRSLPGARADLPQLAPLSWFWDFTADLREQLKSLRASPSRSSDGFDI